MNKLFWVALFAIFASISYTHVCDNGWDPEDDERECLYDACFSATGNCFASNGANPCNGCRAYTASCQSNCYNDCYGCVLCLYNNGCCAHGDIVTQVPICESDCLMNSPNC